MKYSDLEKKMQAYVIEVDDFEAWANALNMNIVAWVRGKGNKGMWEVVLRISQIMGILRKHLSRKHFAELVICVCPALSGETSKALAASMEKVGANYNDADVKKYDELPETKWLKIHGKEVETLILAEINRKAAKPASAATEASAANCSAKPASATEASSKPASATNPSSATASATANEPAVEPPLPEEPKTLTERLERALREIVSEGAGTPCSRIWVRKGYRKGGSEVNPALSVANYSSAEFLEQGRPSYVMAYECVDELVTKDKIKLLWYDYSQFRAMKLIIVSPHGFRADVRAEAENNGIGLIRVQEAGQLTYVLPRAMDESEVLERQLAGLEGGAMEEGMLFYDGYRMCSLAGWLGSLGVQLRDRKLPTVPPLSYERIEHFVEKLRRRPGLLTLKNNFEVRGMDRLAEAVKLKIEWSDLPKGQLGCLDIRRRTIFISNVIRRDDHRMRFTLAHELGHYFLHYDTLCQHIALNSKEIQALGTNYQSEKQLQRMEQQANSFASSLLMPKYLVMQLAARYFNEKEITMGYVFRDDQPCNRSRSMEVLSAIADAMNVSIEATKVKMRSMGLYREGSAAKRLRDIQTIRQLMSYLKS